MKASPRSACAATALAAATSLAVVVSPASGSEAVVAADSQLSEVSRHQGKRARVVEVTDGDSIKVRLLRSDAPRNVRLIGIDTPEVHGRVECGGPAASRSLKKMLALGSVVRLVRDPEQDNRDLFNRLLRYVEKPGGQDVGRKQLRRGWARVFVFGGETFERIRSYRRAANAAEAAERGTWSRC
jgi:endonuclease YncB( thermonuclease family)